MKNPLARLAVAALLTAGLLVAIILAVPTFRMLVVGSKLRYAFAPNYPNLEMKLLMAEATEVRGPEESGPLTLPSADELDVQLKEEIQPGPREQTVFYVCGETRTEADDARQKGRRLSGSRLMARILPLGGVAAAQAVDHRDEMFFQGTALRPLFMSLWPPVPAGWMRPGASWTTDVKVEVGHRTLSQPVQLNYRLTYTLGRFIDEAGVRAADISWQGKIEARPPAVGSGNITGACLLGLDSGNCLNGGYNLAQSFDVPLHDLPGDMHLAWQQEQIARYQRMK